MKYVTTLIIGAGQAGLAMSKHLADRSIDHVLLERGKVANSWQTERWDSLRLLTPNWQSRLPGFDYDGTHPDDYMDMPQVVNYLQTYARATDAPVQEETTVLSVRRTYNGYIVQTDQDSWNCQTLVLANGACNIASVPKISEAIPASIRQLSPLDYKNPGDLEEGGVLVVGASATGVQLAREIRASGRDVTISVGEHIRVPRRYRDRDIKWWMEVTGILGTNYREIDDIKRVRKLPSLQLVGSHEGMLDLNTLSDEGVEIVGRVAGLHNDQLQFSGSLANMCAMADLKMNRLLESIDQWALEHGYSNGAPPHRFEPTSINTNPVLSMKLKDSGIKTILWATGYRPDYSWLDVPILDHKGAIKHDGGVVDSPGMYVLGLPFLRTRKSTLIDGVGDDAEYLADHLAASLSRVAA